MSTNQIQKISDAASSSSESLMIRGESLQSISSLLEEKRAGGRGSSVEEQALESHEVIELQTFSERKVWIEEKIKFLENLPPIEVFTGLDSLRERREECPGLPTREQLQQWQSEHDTIEKETEVFDKGELKKLRLLTKAATQRNLSPADTDIIEITLTTIYALDKLLHLLRDRSEHLELLGIRLDWEEQRTASWKDRTQILSDLDTFIKTRARWSPTIYENFAPATTRRGSVSSDSCPGLSRSERFKLTELLARDAAQHGARITGLCHGSVAAAGRLLDKLIDHSRKPVPDELLDEQDRLEEKSIHDLANVSKFTMGLVMQWKRADEIYVETVKDQSAARDLVEDIQAARTQHPTPQRSGTFASHVEAIVRRLSVRGNPSSKINTFPRPTHPLYPDQSEVNEALASALSAEIVSANELIERAEKASKGYTELCEAVSRVESVVSAATVVANSFTSILQRLREGVPADKDEGLPPDLSSESSLAARRHSVFIALLPSITSQIFDVTEMANDTIKDSQLSFAVLENESIDPSFKANSTAAIARLIALRDETKQVADLVTERVARVREARELSSTLEDMHQELFRTRTRLNKQMKVASWKQENSANGTPPTPESPSIDFISSPTLSVDSDLAQLGQSITDNIEAGFKTLAPHLGEQLKEHLAHRAGSLRSLYQGLQSMQEVHQAIREQSESMSAVREEYHAFQLRVEDVKQRLTALTSNLLNDTVSVEESIAEEATIKSDLGKVQDDVSDFIDQLSARVRFVSRHPSLTPPAQPTCVRPPFLRKGSSHDVDDDDVPMQISIDLPQLDATVRAESNAYVMRLSGALDSVARASEHLTCAQLAKELDTSLASTIDTVYQSQEHTKSLDAAFDGLAPSETLVQDLDELIAQVDETSRTRRLSVSRCFSPLRDLLRRMDTSSQSLDASVRQTLYAARVRSVDDIETRYHSWTEDISSLKTKMVAARAKEVQRLEEVRLAEEKRKREEEERRKAAEAEAARLAEEARRKEEERKAEEARLAELARLEEERLKREAEEAERLRIEKEKQEAEERERVRLEEEEKRIRALAEEERRQKAEADTARLLQERSDIETRLQQAEALLAEERTRQIERDRALRKEAEEERRKLDVERKKMQRAVKDAEDRLTRAELDAKKAVGDEKKRLEYEIKAMKAEHNKTLETFKKTSRPSISVVKPPESQGFPTIQEDDDVFGSSTAPSTSRMAIVRENNRLLSEIGALRKRLRLLNINETARPPAKKSIALPTREQATSLRSKFNSIKKDASELPATYESTGVNAELQSLRSELEGSTDLLDHIDKLVLVTEAIERCDTLLSDLLEHIDSFPELPTEVSTLHTGDKDATPEQQMSDRLAFTKQNIEEMRSKCRTVPHDPRVVAEQNRLQQTWLELEEMAGERVGKKSRPTSSISSRPNSSARTVQPSTAAAPRPSGSGQRKRDSYAGLSVSNANLRGGKLAPPLAARRSMSGSSESRSRSSSRMSMGSVATNRSVSGPMVGSTFASRQRTTSLTAKEAVPVRSPPVGRTRAESSAVKRVRSSTISENTTSSSRSTTTSTSSWSRAPRNSLSSLVTRAMTPQKDKPAAPPPRKKYIANPKHKLDVAVGDVVNNLPVGIKIEAVKETWKDQSGTYWIGNQDPKLCFCRILRSQTVMVRVGGGWAELSKFITNHFADSFKLLPDPRDSPSRAGSKEEKWISSATLLEATREEAETRPSTPLRRPPQTPEPTSKTATASYVPSFSLMTPSGSAHSPKSVKSPGSPATSPKVRGTPTSPLKPMRFLRRDPEASFMRPATPSKPLRAKTPVPPKTRPAAVWKP